MKDSKLSDDSRSKSPIDAHTLEQSSQDTQTHHEPIKEQDTQTQKVKNDEKKQELAKETHEIMTSTEASTTQVKSL